MNLYHLALCIECNDDHMTFVYHIVNLCPSLCLGTNDATRALNKLYYALNSHVIVLVMTTKNSPKGFSMQAYLSFNINYDKDNSNKENGSVEPSLISQGWPEGGGFNIP